MNSYSVEAVLKATGAEQFAKDFENVTKQVEGMTSAAKQSTGGIKSMVSGVGKIAGAIGLTKAVSAGFDMIKNSVGQATSRIDTMEQFERVMTTMTGSTEETAAALDRTNEIVKGTGYGLDTAAKSVQNFVTRGLGVDQATDTIEAWGDAVAFYGDGSDATFASVTDALSKMTTKGNIDMEQMNRLFDAGIPALDIYANAVGLSTDEVARQISQGAIGAEDFMDVMNTAFAEGVDGFDSISGAAKDAGSSWGATFDNMRAAVARGVGSIIKSIDEMLVVNGLPDMRQMVANFGSAFENALNKVAEAIGPVIETLAMMGEGIQMVWETIQSVFSSGNMDVAASQIKYMIDSMLQNISEALPSFLEKGFEVVQRIITGITQKVPEFVQKGLELMVAFANVLSDSIPKLLRLGMDFVTSLIRGLSNKLPEWLSKGVEMVVKIANSIAQNLPKIIQAGGRLLSSAAKGFRDKFPEMLNAAVQLIARLLSSLLSNLPKLLAAGVKLILSLIKGIVQSIPKVLGAMRDLAGGILDAVRNIDLSAAGRAIIQGFLRGLQSAFESVKRFVGGIGTWIKNNKGPISYDKRLLIDAGNAIMDGLDKGLQDNFRNVQRTVGGMAGAIERSFGNPSLAVSGVDVNGSVARSNAQVNSVIRHDHTIKSDNFPVRQPKPANITVQIGNSEFRAFVEDIDREMGSKAALRDRWF